MSDTPNAPHLTVWGAGTPRTLRVYWILHELGLTYDHKPIGPRTGETKTSGYRQLNPKEKVPTLQDGELTITESAAIVMYLADRYGGPLGFAPLPGTPERAAYYEWAFFTMTELDALSLYVLRRHIGLAHVYGEAPAAVQASREGFTKLVAVAEQRLACSGPYVLGAMFSAADILLTSCLVWADQYQLPLMQQLQSYLKRTTARPAYTAAVKINAWP